MFLHFTEATYVRDYVLWIRFNNGSEREVDLANDLNGEVFTPLTDVATFKRFHVDPEIDTVVWENGADFAPEFLHGLLMVKV